LLCSCRRLLADRSGNSYPSRITLLADTTFRILERNQPRRSSFKRQAAWMDVEDLFATSQSPNAILDWNDLTMQVLAEQYLSVLNDYNLS